MVGCDGVIRARVNITNTGELAGDEVVQLYTHFLDAHVTRPNKQLQGFRRVSLEAGESRTITFELSCSQLGYYNEHMHFVVEPGHLDVAVGTSSSDLPLRAQVTLTGEAADVMGRRSYICRTTVE